MEGKGTDRKTLEELLSQYREVGVQGCPITLTTPEAMGSAAVGRAMLRRADAMIPIAERVERVKERAKGGRRRKGAPVEPAAPPVLDEAAAFFEASCEVATLAVAATLIKEGERHPSGDRADAGRLVRLALAEAGKGADVMTLPLVAAALELCGFVPGAEGEGEEGGPPA